MKKLDDVGPEVLRFLRESMAIDPEWSVVSPRRFEWWGHRLRQVVSATPAVDSGGLALCRLSARTDVARGLTLTGRLEEALAALNMAAAMNALVLDREDRRLFLSCHMVVHREIAGWAAPLFMSAVATQAAEAHLQAGPLSTLLGCEPDESAHPVSGSREEPDEMLSVAETLFAPAGREPSRFPASELDEIAEDEAGPSVFSNASDGRLTAEFPFHGATPAMLTVGREGGPETALFTVSVREEHPRYGSGCLMLLRLPVSGFDGPAANDLNRADADTAPTYGFGAWCVENGTPVHALFLPSAVYRPGLMKAMTLGACGHATWARDHFARGERGADA